MVIADLPRAGQLSFQDPLMSNFIGVIDLHYVLGYYLVQVLFFVVLILTVELFAFTGKIKTFFPPEYRLYLTEESALEIG